MRFKVETKEIEGKTWIKFNSKYDQFRYYYGNLVAVVAIIVLIVLGILLLSFIFKNIDLLKTNPCSLCESLGYTCSKFMNFPLS